jgi:uncharacterized protein
MQDTKAHANRLIDATSPYLLQHAHNPVDWYEWGEEALRRAREEDRPILLSIGYAACHWCHVMAHESFEDPDIAALMNEHFVAIKVDREERPDLDAIYMDAVQQMTGQGGWPMTVFLTPEGEPFYAGTYFPPEDRHGMPGFPRLLRAVADAWKDRRDELVGQGSRVTRQIGLVGHLAESVEPLNEVVLRTAHAALSRAFDREWGGFGPAPKFPQPMTLEFLLRCHLRGYPGALDMVTVTLDRMAAGGIYDHAGGGFHRYSTDERWLVPHFEKMLYDNAQLARLYLHGWQVTGRAEYRRVTEEILEYLLREMRHEGGGFFSAQDADSEGVEGKFYVWGYDDLVSIAGEAVARYFGATPEGNWEGVNVLWTPRPGGQVAADAGMTLSDLDRQVAEARPRLYAERDRRVHPITDDKILASWNGLAIAAFAEAGRALEEPRYIEAARVAADFVLEELRRKDGRVLRAWREGRASGPAYVDDYAMMAAACLALYESTFDPRWMREARALSEDMIDLFHDAERGGFFQTGSDAEQLVIRPKEVYDNAVPAGNSVGAEVLQRLGHLTGDVDLERVGVSVLRLLRDLMERAPGGFGHALSALDLYLSAAKEVAVIGDPSDERTRRLVAEVWKRYLPSAVLAVGRPDDAEAADAVPLLADRPLVDGKPAAYVCERFTCQRPVTEPSDLASQLEI